MLAAVGAIEAAAMVLFAASALTAFFVQRFRARKHLMLPGLVRGPRGTDYSGDVRGIPVTVEHGEPTTITLSSTGIDPGLLLVLSDLDIEFPVATGDERFDRKFRIRGSQGLVAALAGKPLRTELLGLRAFELELHRGVIVARQLSKRRIGEAIKSLRRLVDLLQTPDDLVSTMVAHVEDEQEMEPVRVKNLKAVVNHAPEDPRVIALCRALLGSSRVSLAVVAASHLAPDPEAEAAVIRLLETDRLDVKTRQGLLGMLSKSTVALDVRRKVYLRAAAHKEPRIRHSAARFLSAAGDEASVAGLIAMLNDDDLSIVASVVRALSGLRITEQVEHGLLTALDRTDRTVRLQAIGILHHAGTLLSIQRLQKLDGLIGDITVKVAANRAVEAIQTRHGTPLAGQLSLSPGQEKGDLSMADPAGGVSVIKDDDDDRNPA